MSTTIFQDVQQGYQQLVSYFTSITTYLTSGGTPPDISTINGQFNTNNLLTYSVNGSYDGASFPVGAAIDAASDFSAIQRELDMGSMQKVSLIASAASDAASESVYYGQFGGYCYGVLGGAPTAGTQS